MALEGIGKQVMGPAPVKGTPGPAAPPGPPSPAVAADDRKPAPNSRRGIPAAELPPIEELSDADAQERLQNEWYFVGGEMFKHYVDVPDVTEEDMGLAPDRLNFRDFRFSSLGRDQDQVLMVGRIGDDQITVVFDGRDGVLVEFDDPDSEMSPKDVARSLEDDEQASLRRYLEQRRAHAPRGEFENLDQMIRALKAQ